MLYTDGSPVEFIGEIAEHENTRFLGEALALLFPNLDDAGAARPEQMLATG